jgi:mRNA interferase MazF
LKRGDIWTAAGGKDYASKPRPVVIIQDDQFDATPSITVCSLTSDPTEARYCRVPIVPDDSNGLAKPSMLMIDKIATVPKEKLGKPIGRLGDEDMLRLNRAIVIFLGLGGK